MERARLGSHILTDSEWGKYPFSSSSGTGSGAALPRLEMGDTAGMGVQCSRQSCGELGGQQSKHNQIYRLAAGQAAPPCCTL